MADVTGLVIGFVALASLFSTCVELFDYIELGRNYAYDYKLACTKMSLLKARLSDWGLSLNIETPGHEHPALRLHWPEEQNVVGRSLFGIKDIFENASLLTEKYMLTPTRSRNLRAIDWHHSNEPNSESTTPGSHKISSSGWRLLRKRASWAIHDKQKFDSFIQDLSFLIDNLEKVTVRIEMPSTAVESKNQTEIKPSGQQPVLGEPARSDNTHDSNGTLDFSKIAPHMSGNIYTGSQIIEQNFGVMGAITKTDKRHIYTGGQKIQQNGFGVMGDASPEALAYLQDRVFARGAGTSPTTQTKMTEEGWERKYSRGITLQDASVAAGAAEK